MAVRSVGVETAGLGEQLFDFADEAGEALKTGAATAAETVAEGVWQFAEGQYKDVIHKWEHTPIYGIWAGLHKMTEATTVVPIIRMMTSALRYVPGMAAWGMGPIGALFTFTGALEASPLILLRDWYLFLVDSARLGLRGVQGKAEWSDLLLGLELLSLVVGCGSSYTARCDLRTLRRSLEGCEELTSEGVFRLFKERFSVAARSIPANKDQLKRGKDYVDMQEGVDKRRGPGWSIWPSIKMKGHASVAIGRFLWDKQVMHPLFQCLGREGPVPTRELVRAEYAHWTMKGVRAYRERLRFTGDAAEVGARVRRGERVIVLAPHTGGLEGANHPFGPFDVLPVGDHKNYNGEGLNTTWRSRLWARCNPRQFIQEVQLPTLPRKETVKAIYDYYGKAGKAQARQLVEGLFANYKRLIAEEGINPLIFVEGGRSVPAWELLPDGTVDAFRTITHNGVEPSDIFKKGALDLSVQTMIATKQPWSVVTVGYPRGTSPLLEPKAHRNVVIPTPAHTGRTVELEMTIHEIRPDEMQEEFVGRVRKAYFDGLRVKEILCDYVDSRKDAILALGVKGTNIDRIKANLSRDDAVGEAARGLWENVMAIHPLRPAAKGTARAIWANGAIYQLSKENPQEWRLRAALQALRERDGHQYLEYDYRRPLTPNEMAKAHKGNAL